MKERVFILNNDLHDFRKAESYGEMIDVTTGKVPIFKTSYVKGLLKQRLEDFREDDYLLITGPALLAILATQILLLRFHSIKLLVFDAKVQDYVVRHINND